MNEPRVSTTKAITFSDGRSDKLCAALQEFLDYGAASGALRVTVDRQQHDRMPGSYSTTVTIEREVTS